MPSTRSLAPRQAAAVSSTTPSASSTAAASASPTSNSPAQPSDKDILPIILPIVVVCVVVGVLIAVAIKINRRRHERAAPTSAPTRTSDNDAPSGVGAWTWLTGRTPSQRAAASAVSNMPRTTEEQRREDRRERRARRLRRTDSGTSLKTIPAYREELADGELMLGKADDSTLNLTQVDSNESNGSMQERPTRWSTSSNARQGSVSHGHATAAADLVSSEPLLRDRSMSPEDVAREQGRTASRASRRSLVGNVRASLRRTLGTSRGFSQNEASEMNEMGTHDAAEQQEDEHNVSIRVTQATEMGGGENTPDTEEERGSPVSANVPLEEAPQYDSIYPTRISFSAADASAQRAAAGGSGAAAAAPQRSVLGSIFGRRAAPAINARGVDSAGDLETGLSGRSRPPTAATHRRFGSSASVLTTLTTSDLSLHPTVSRTSNAPSTRSRFGLSNFGMSSTSLAGSVSATDSPTRPRQSISGPLEGSVIRTSMAGEQRPTPDQLRFLSSVESLGRFGTPIGGHEVAPPAWATLGIASPVEAGEGMEEVVSPTVDVASPSAVAPLPLGAARPPPLLLPTELQVRRQRGDTLDTTSPTSATSPRTSGAPIAAILSSPVGTVATLAQVEAELDAQDETASSTTTATEALTATPATAATTASTNDQA